MTRERRRKPTSSLASLAGAVLIGSAVFLSVTRSSVSETLIGTLLAFGVVLLGVTLPVGLGGRKEDDQ